MFVRSISCGRGEVTGCSDNVSCGCSYWPGWCAPRIPENKENESEEGPTAQARNVDERGLVPPSWLVSLLAGDVSFLPVSWMGQVWDWILTSPSRSVSFFLTLAVLERAADNLILLTGDELHKGLIKAFEFDDDSDWLGDWWETAKVLQTATPVSVLEQLQKAEDEAVQQAVLRRQERAEAALKARLAAERQAHIEEQERKAEEARARLNRARLVAFYRTHAPDKEGNIDKILETYSDKLEVLEAKLFKKYGESFNPSLKEKKKEEKITRAPNKLLATMSARRNVSNKEEEEAFPTDQIEAPAASKTDQVAVLVKAEEVLPVVCWSKEAAAIRGANRRAHITNSSGVPLKFFLVDSRSEEAAAEQGRFPTAVSLSPETMLDPEKLQKAEEQFESLRGAVHVVVMGEGFSAIPKLYSQKLSSTLEEAMKQDDSRTNICALFFFKKGFPFVSILDGGFAAAHSWLVREGESHHLDAASALIDYNPESSVFGQMEKLHTASATEKASRAMQNLMEKSLVAMTLQARQLEKLASDMESGRGRFGMSFLTRAKSQSAKTEDSAGNDENKGPRFVNPFANKSTESSAGTETSQGHRFSKMFNRQKSSEKLADSLGGEAESATVGVVPFRNPFARKQESEGEKSADSLGGEAEGGSGGVQFRSPFVRKQDSDTAAKSTTEESSGTENEGAAKPAVVNPFKGLGAAINNSMNRNVENTNADTPADTTTAAATPASSQPSTEDSKTGPASAGDKRNMFGGFGATQAGPPAIPNVLKRNPFRGFSGGAAKKAPEDNSKKTGGFGGGFNSFRTFGRVRPAASKDQDGAGGNDESITFD